MNVVVINLVSTLVLWIRGYRPERKSDEVRSHRAALKQLLVLVLTVLVLSSFLGITTVDFLRNEQFERTVQDIVDERGDEVLSYEIRYQTTLFSNDPTTVVVRTTGDADSTADSFHRRIRERTGMDVTVVAIQEEAAVAEESVSSR